MTEANCDKTPESLGDVAADPTGVERATAMSENINGESSGKAGPTEDDLERTALVSSEDGSAVVWLV